MRHALVLLTAVGLLAWPATGQEPARPVDAAPVDAAPAGDQQQEKIAAAVAKAVAFLRAQQQADGAISDGPYPTALTALSVIALLAVGHLPDDPTPEGQALAKALAFVLKEDRQDQHTGYYGAADDSRMYGHGIVTLMLAETLGMGADAPQDALIRQRLDKAVALILAAQAQKKPDNTPPFGGWRYLPDAADSDLSVTVWQVLALRAARNAGLEVPKQPIADAVRYIKSCYQSARHTDGTPQNRKSGFAYQPGNAPTYAMAAAGLLALQVCGEYDAPEVRGAADWLLDCQRDRNVDFFYYGTYYYAQGMYQCGGKYAEQAAKIVPEMLRGAQNPDGSWQANVGNEQKAGRVYATAMALLSLSVAYHYLPIYQR